MEVRTGLPGFYLRYGRPGRTRPPHGGGRRDRRFRSPAGIDRNRGLTPFCELHVAAEVIGIKDCLKVLEAVAAEGMAAIGAKRTLIRSSLVCSQSSGLFELLFEFLAVAVFVHCNSPCRYDEEAAKMFKPETVSYTHLRA